MAKRTTRKSPNKPIDPTPVNTDAGAGPATQALWGINSNDAPPGLYAALFHDGGMTVIRRTMVCTGPGRIKFTHCYANANGDTGGKVSTHRVAYVQGPLAEFPALPEAETSPFDTL